jgi:uncharacterized protein with HEPN domain
MLADVKNDLIYLLNILEYIGKIQKYTGETNSPEELYEINNQMNFNSSINLLVNIGENVLRISNELKTEYAEVEWQQIKNDFEKLQTKIEEIIKIKNC